MSDPITVDFETESIEGNPIHKPPKPVGVAIWVPGEEPIYTDDWEYLERVWSSGKDLLFHNSPFDIEVGVQHLDLPRPLWNNVHDTMYPLFFADPYARTLSLKPSAERYLEEPPEEQNALHNWILRNVPEATPKTAGTYVSRAPFELVQPYAIGDVTRTKRLYDLLMPSTPREPYDRERRLAPILSEGTRRGIRIDRARLEKDIGIYQDALARCQEMIINTLKCHPDINLDSDRQLADALDSAGLVDQWELTPKGHRSVSKPNLKKCLNDKTILHLLEYKSSLNTCLGTFMLPWYDMSEGDGRVHPSWNSVRNTDYGGTGARTGRLSSSGPNFQNVPNVFGQVVPAGLPPLPEMRIYCLPEPGHVWHKRDFSSQEVRILAHFEDGQLMRLYQVDPNFDPHQMARDEMLRIFGVDRERKQVKVLAFGIIYGMGIPALTGALECPPHEAATFKNNYLTIFPGVEKLSRMTKARGESGQGITTWGGRVYQVEPPAIVGGRMRNFSYKLLNYLIQGSAADQTKQCICDWYDEYRTSTDEVFLATVHDEINISVPEEFARHGMESLRGAMEQDLFDVPMRTESFVGPNWQELELVPDE